MSQDACPDEISQIVSSRCTGSSCSSPMPSGRFLELTTKIQLIEGATTQGFKCIQESGELRVSGQDSLCSIKQQVASLKALVNLECAQRKGGLEAENLAEAVSKNLGFSGRRCCNQWIS